MARFIFELVLFLFWSHYVTSQVCNETKSIFQEVPETFRFTYIETYEEPCVIFCSMKTRQSVNITSRIVQRYQNVTVNVCCEGYVENEKHEGDGIFCDPICNPPCQNGYCRKPNQCACEAGYALDPLNPYICKPLCLEGCDIPNCIPTKTPQCYSNDTELSNPICTESCINALCIAPEVCQCLPGYYKTSASICEPYKNSCEHGTRISPDTCKCDLGWQWKCGSCEPVCFQCEHGYCVSPGECQCESGYVKSDKGKCEPRCSNGCANGKCVGPETCVCDPGWYVVNEGGECIPHCDMNCDHGDCIAPGICDCHPGYQLDTSREQSRCVPNRKDCEGISFSPEDCKCEPPYKVSFFTDEGDNCDCFNECSNYSKICTKSTCLFMDVPYTNEVNEESIKIPDVNKTIYEPVDDSTSTFPTLENETIEERDFVEAVSNATNTIKKSEVLGLPFPWIYVILAFGALIGLLILGFVVKIKYFKAQSLNSADKNNEIKVCYTNKMS